MTQVINDDLIIGKWYKLTEDYCKLKKGMVFKFIKYQSRRKLYAHLDHMMFGISDYNYLAPPVEHLVEATENEINKQIKL